MRSASPRLVVAAGAVVLLLALAAALLLRGGGEGPAPADAATRLIPSDALVYLHLSTDRERKGTEDAERIARGFPGFERARKTLVGRLSAPGCDVALDDLEGKEAAFALLDAGGGQAGSLVLVDTGTDQSRAAVKTCGAVQVMGIGTFLVVGQPQSLQRAKELSEGNGRSLATNPLYVQATKGLRQSRVLDGWVTATGVRRLLAPQAGLLGAAGTLLDQPGLRASAFGLSAAEEGARLTVTSMLDGAKRTGTFKPFVPALAKEVPDDALAYLGLSGLSTATTRLLSASGGAQLAGGTAGLGALLARASTELSKQAGGNLDRDVLALFRKEVAVSITASTPAPTLTIIARTRDEAATKAALQRLQGPLAKVLGPAGQAPPVWKPVGEDFQLVPAEGIEINYGVFDGKLVISTKLAGITAARRRDGRLSDKPEFEAALGRNESEPVTSLVFLDFSQLLRLGEQTGLNDSRAYLAVKDDLQRVRSVGARSTSQSDGRQSTAELLLTIP